MIRDEEDTLIRIEEDIQSSFGFSKNGKEDLNEERGNLQL
jgi:hypothetical protein